MSTRDLIVIGSSAGGVDALVKLCAELPADLPAAVVVAQHVAPGARSMLPQLLDRAGPLPACSPTDGQALEPGRIYVGAPDHHILVRPGQLLMRRGPYENRTRPAVNALFRSAAIAYGGRAVGVVLTGLLDDGTDGLIAIKAAGGYSMVQDPDDAEWPSMPRNALKRDHVDRVAPLAGMGALLAELVRQDATPSVPLPAEYITEDLIAAQEFVVVPDRDLETPGSASTLSCPDCGGVLNQIASDRELRFRCQVGHAYTPLGLADAQAGELERALAVAVRTHRDRVRLFDKMVDNADTRDMPHAKRRWEAAGQESLQMVDVLEQAIASLRRAPVDGDG